MSENQNETENKNRNQNQNKNKNKNENQNDNSKNGRVLDRATLRHSQTPQGFHFPLLLRAHNKAAQNKKTASDDAALLQMENENENINIAFIAGDDANIKLTTQADMTRFASLTNTANPASPAISTPPATQEETHTASGFDVHAFAPAPEANATLTLGGIQVPHTHRLLAHSDGDVVLHALTDALLGTLAAGDIGEHFPPSNPAHKNRNSADFLTFATNLIHQKNGRIVHLDTTIICEQPKLTPHKSAMQKQIATLCNIAPHRVSIKATTTEGLGALGRGDGIAVQATASVTLPAQVAGAKPPAQGRGSKAQYEAQIKRQK